MMKASSCRGPQHQPIATPSSSPRFLSIQNKTKAQEELFVLKSEEEYDGSRRRSRPPYQSKKSSFKPVESDQFQIGTRSATLVRWLSGWYRFLTARISPGCMMFSMPSWAGAAISATSF